MGQGLLSHRLDFESMKKGDHNETGIAGSV